MARNKNSIDDIYTYYYLNQAGTGFGNVYAGGVYQRGHGIGSFLSGLFRCVLPMLKSGTATVGNELFKTGANIMSDITQNGDFDTAIKRRGKETIENLGRLAGEKMFGRGYMPNVSRKRKQSQTSTRGGKKAKKPAKKPTKKEKPANKKKTKLVKKKNNKRSPIKKKQRTKKDLFDIFA